MNNSIQEYVIDTDIQEYIIDTLTNNSLRNYDILKYRQICKHWKKYIDNQLFKFKNDNLNNYFSAMRICNKLPKDGISLKKMLILYEFATPNCKEIKYKCSNCGRLKYKLGDYDGQQNNHTTKMDYSTDVETTMGTATRPKGHYGQSSAACSSAAASVTAVQPF